LHEFKSSSLNKLLGFDDQFKRKAWMPCYFRCILIQTSRVNNNNGFSEWTAIIKWHEFWKK